MDSALESWGGSGQVRYEVLGPVRAWRAGTLLDLGPSQRRVILSVLLLHANRPISRDQLIDAVWGEELPKYATNLAQKHISALRRQLEPGRPGRAPSDLLTWTDSGYLLTVSPGDLDLQSYDEGVARARIARVRGDHRAAVDALRRALRLFPGQPFDGLTSPMLDAHRDRLLEQRIGLVEDRIELDLVLGAGPDLVSELRKLATDHPLRDRVSALLMLALYRDGQRAEALSVFHDVRRRLSHELGVDPPAALRTLHQRILAGDPVADLLRHGRGTSTVTTLEPERQVPSVPRIDVTVPHPARMHDYWLGGQYNFASDRELAEEISRLMPSIDETVRLNQAFIRRALRFVIGSGVRQFIDLTSALPTQGSTVQLILDRPDPGHRLANVDHDPVAVAQAALLFDRYEGTALIQTDIRDIDGVFDEAGRAAIDLGQPTGLIMSATHFIPDSWDPGAIIASYRDRLVPGSYLVLLHVSADAEVPGLDAAINAFHRTRFRVTRRSQAQVEAMCTGFELVPPGVVGFGHWRPDGPDDYSSDPAINTVLWAGVARRY